MLTLGQRYCLVPPHEAQGCDMSKFTVFLKVTGGDKLSLEVTQKQTIAELKAAIATKCDIPAENQRLIYKGQVLKDEKTVEDYGKQGFRDHAEQLHVLSGFIHHSWHR